jgi:exopolyphosphatase/guanosine-5'-triphosphate,3'-diphosphate pyrophosphatase
LEIGALLHDIGHFINTIDHDKHGYYLLNANRLIGLSLREQNIVANLVRYHRRASPSAEDEDFKSLPQKDRLIIFKLAALLRLADSLDINHTGKVTDVILREAKTGWRMKISGEKDLMLVNWALEKRKSHFRDVFGVNLEMEE